MAQKEPLQPFSLSSRYLELDQDDYLSADELICEQWDYHGLRSKIR